MLRRCYGLAVPRQSRRTKRLAVLSEAAHITAMTEALEIRVHGAAALPTLVYLPGLHGDWTLVGSFRRALSGRARFVELTYPRTLTWSLDDYAQEIEDALAGQGITRGWLLGESFGSQVVWPLVARNRFQTEGVILAGGFVRHPMRWGVRLAERLGGAIPLRLVTGILFGYAKVARFRFRHAPEVFANINEFIARRTELDRQAAVHRLRLIAANDPCCIAQQVRVPVYALSGLLDPIVPWFWVRPWLKRNCPPLRDYRIIWGADHTVLATGFQAAAKQVLRWMAVTPRRA
jgi:pimeloyl-ACP methyl ester carboxylesterase